jgi:hypothetical protein
LKKDNSVELIEIKQKIRGQAGDLGVIKKAAREKN